eukprot:CAMPEP_0182838980 /NCGR_PEP_ID=MMETSP0006_2-20121128/23618_1 /TAXON_ID=97485 /ORGANISM="Prymnesium parvum, Strain Texoma1" /LENGTH=74 /DNA_ID=CAMNT_0024968091 /DNA_START=621 /DNA_END=842 /DNA_ORIENTATION=+
MHRKGRLPVVSTKLQQRHVASVQLEMAQKRGVHPARSAPRRVGRVRGDKEEGLDGFRRASHQRRAVDDKFHIPC